MDIPSAVREAVLAYVSDQAAQDLGLPALGISLPDEPLFAEPAGCFVSLHRCDTHALRGCIGSVRSDRPLAGSLVQAAKGVFRDPRFVDRPVTREEWPELEIEVTILGPIRPASSPLDFNPLQQGILLTIGERSGLFLPQVACETGWSREQLLARLCTEKLDVAANAWKSRAAKLEVFSVEVLGPRPCVTD